MKKDFLCLTDWTLAELEGIFDLTRELKAKQKEGEKHRLLKGKTLGMLFEKSSTRTRVSFEVGMYQLGGHALFLSSSSTQMGRGEPIKDTARVMSRYVDGIMIRTFSQDAVEELARLSDIPVINGLTDSYHPCQLMADLFTVIEHKSNYRDLIYCWIGDGNNMANSWINAAAVFGFELRIATPVRLRTRSTGHGPRRKNGGQGHLHQRSTGSCKGRPSPEHRCLGQHGPGRRTKGTGKGLC